MVLRTTSLCIRSTQRPCVSERRSISAHKLSTYQPLSTTSYPPVEESMGLRMASSVSVCLRITTYRICRPGCVVLDCVYVCAVCILVLGVGKSQCMCTSVCVRARECVCMWAYMCASVHGVCMRWAAEGFSFKAEAPCYDAMTGCVNYNPLPCAWSCPVCSSCSTMTCPSDHI